MMARISGLFHQSQFPYCSEYEARRVQTIYQISISIRINIRKYIYYENSERFPSICRNWFGSAHEVTQDYTISLRFVLKKTNKQTKEKLPAENK